MKTLSKSLLTGALISFAGLVAAQPPGGGPMPFAAFDLNGDGSISPQEFAAVHAQRMQAPQGPGYGAGRMNPPRFEEFDQNGDDLLSPDELAQGQLQRQQQRPMGPGGPGMGRGKGCKMPSFAEFDLNRDGVLEPQEFEQARAQRIKERAEQGYLLRNLPNAPPFSSIDANSDGVVTPDEFAAAQALHRQSRQP